MIYQVLTTCLGRHVLLLHQGLHFGEVTRVSGHVGGQNDANKALSKCFKVISGEVLKEVVFLTVENSESLSSMEILLNGLITVPDGSV